MTDFDVLVVGSGHAGCEAALAAARMGCRTAVITLNLQRTAHMPCNCSIGGPAKGHLVREIDALGGQMGITIDCTLTHIRFVGTGKGPAVRTLRAHADKAHYPAEMLRTLQLQRRAEAALPHSKGCPAKKCPLPRKGNSSEVRDGLILNDACVVIMVFTPHTPSAAPSRAWLASPAGV